MVRAEDRKHYSNLLKAILAAEADAYYTEDKEGKGLRITYKGHQNLETWRAQRIIEPEREETIWGEEIKGWVFTQRGYERLKPYMDQLKQQEQRVKKGLSPFAPPVQPKPAVKMGRPKKDVNTNKLSQLRKEGKSITMIATEMGISVGLAWKKLKQLREKGELVDEKKCSPGRPRKKIDIKKVSRLRKEGKSIRKIAKELGTSRDLIGKALKELREKQQWITEKKTRGGRPRKEIDPNKLSQLRREGKSIRKIAKELGVSKSLVGKTLKEF